MKSCTSIADRLAMRSDPLMQLLFGSLCFGSTSLCISAARWLLTTILGLQANQGCDSDTWRATKAPRGSFSWPGPSCGIDRCTEAEGGRAGKSVELGKFYGLICGSAASGLQGETVGNQR